MDMGSPEGRSDQRSTGSGAIQTIWAVSTKTHALAASLCVKDLLNIAGIEKLHGA